MLSYFARLKPCLIGIEACGGAHYWSRMLSQSGHCVRMMAPSFVKPYLKANKNDRNDAEAICEAVQRPNMRFVKAKSLEQQAMLGISTMAVNCLPIWAWCRNNAPVVAGIDYWVSVNGETVTCVVCSSMVHVP